MSSIRLHVPVSVRVCTIDYLNELTCIYICALLCFSHVKFYVPVYYHVNYCSGKSSGALSQICAYANVQLLLLLNQAYIST